MLAGCEAAVPPAKMAPLGGLDPDTKGLVILSADISPKHPTWNFTVPACAWYGVRCNATNGRVCCVEWVNMGLNGTPCLDSLPEYLYYLSLDENALTGTPDLTSLNLGLVTLILSNNAFSGIPDLSSLPKDLQSLDLSSNYFSGTPALTSLPEYLNYLGLEHNALTGTPDLSSLPKGLKHLYIWSNELSGNGTFTQNASWCVKAPPTAWQSMCVGDWNGLFDCAQGLWHCPI